MIKKTAYIDEITDLIEYLEKSLNRDMGIPNNRHKCSARVFESFYNTSSIEEKELSKWLMSAGNRLDLDPLELGHLEREEEIEEYRAMLLEMIDYLKSYLPENIDNQ